MTNQRVSVILSKSSQNLLTPYVAAPLILGTLLGWVTQAGVVSKLIVRDLSLNCVLSSLVKFLDCGLDAVIIIRGLAHKDS